MGKGVLFPRHSFGGTRDSFGARVDTERYGKSFRWSWETQRAYHKDSITKSGEVKGEERDFPSHPQVVHSLKSMKRISDGCRKLGFHRWTHLDIHQLAATLSPKIRGWLYYYGRFHKTGMEGIFSDAANICSISTTSLIAGNFPFFFGKKHQILNHGSDFA